MGELKKLAMAQRNAVALLIVQSIITGAVIIAQAYFIVKIVDAVFLKDASFQSVLPDLYILLPLLVLRTVLNAFHGWIGVKMAAAAKKEVRRKLIDYYASNPLLASLSGQSGRKTGILMDAIDELDSYFSKYIPQLIQATIVPIMLLIAISTQHIYSGLIILVTAPFIPIAFILVGMRTKQKSEEQLHEMTMFSGKFLDTLQALTTLKLYGRAKRQRDEIKKSSIGFREATMEVLKVAFLSALAMEFITMLASGIVALEVGLRLVIFQSISFFTAFFVLTLVPEFFIGLRELSSAFHTGRGSMGAAKLIEEELSGDHRQVQWGDQTLPAGPPEISLENIGFEYGEKGFKLGGVQAQFPPYSQIAIIGRSGSGKTTLLHLIAGLLDPEKGEIRLNGQPRSKFSEENWFSSLSYISQQPYLFTGTIKDNIELGLQASDEEVDIAISKAGLTDLVRGLPKGINTPIGEAGRGLSGGEKQRVALARAFLKKPSVILFDEPTTGLDLKTEKILQQSIKELSKTSTVITVAHRLHTIKNADLILLIEAGKLKASGTHEELLQVEEYREMVSVQGGDRT